MHTKWPICFCLFLVSILGCAKREIQKYQDTQPFMGTPVSITVFSEDADQAGQAIKSAFAKIAELEGILSKHNPNSDVARLNQTQSGKIKVSPLTLAAIQKAVEFGNLSNGAFDITVEPALKLWQEAEKQDSLPRLRDRKQAVDLIGYNDILLEPASCEIGFNKPGMSIDLGGIAKGSIVDEAVKILKSKSITAGLIVAGGDLYAFGNNPERKAPWLIGVRNPLNPEENVKYLEITDKAVATSGHYMRFYTVKGKKYSHIVDPRSGWPVQENIASVTVIASDSLTADALATAICILEPEEGLKLAESVPGVETLIILNDGNKLSFLQSKGLSALLKQN